MEKANSTRNAVQISKNNKKKKRKNKEKLGRREVKNGVVLYKKVSTDQLKDSIQFGLLNFFIKEQNLPQITRDLTIEDFEVLETIKFPKAGTSTPNIPPHGLIYIYKIVLS